MGATPGMWGTIKMQMAFLPVYQFLKMKPVLMPEVLLSKANEKFDSAGKLTDADAIKIIKQKLEALVALIKEDH